MINSVVKQNLVQSQKRLSVYNVLAKPTLVYESEAWTIKNKMKTTGVIWNEICALDRIYNSGQEKK
jgi:spore coat protein CotF